MSSNQARVILMLAVIASSPGPAQCQQRTGSTTAEAQPTSATWTLAKGWQIPVTVPDDPTQDDWINLGWETFIALNWPAEWSNWPATPAPGVIGGQPNENASITMPLPQYTAVWQTYLSPEQVFLNEGADPGSWAAPNNQATTHNGLPVLGGFSKGVASSEEKGGELNEATDNPLIAQDGNFVNFEIRMNQSEFTYLTHYTYYDAAAQQAATANGGSIASIPHTGTESILGNLPVWAQQGALEIKAAWRIVTNTQFASRYFTMNAYRELPNGDIDGPHQFGLVGLHILRLTPTSGSTWYWATFEQVDNVRIDQTPVPTGLTPSFNPGTTPPYPTYAQGFEYNGTTTPPPPVASGQPLPQLNPVDTSFIDNAIHSGAAAANEKYQGMLPGTVWQYYQMIGVLNPGAAGSPYSVPPFGNPTNSDQMVNTTMETYSQGTASAPRSCLTCHAHAAPSGAEMENGYPKQAGNQIFTFLFDDAQSSEQD